MLYVASLAFAVLGVLAFSQAYTETTTLTVARSMAARQAGLALDSALAEAHAKLVARMNDWSDAEMNAMRSHPLDGGPWEAQVPLEATPGAFGTEIEPVKARVFRLKPYAGQPGELREYRFGLLELTARVRVKIQGSNQTVGRQGTRVHEFKQSAAIPPNPFYTKPIWIKDFPYLELKHAQYQADVDHIADDARGISRRTRVQVGAFVRQMVRSRDLIGPWIAAHPDPNPRWTEVMAARPETQVWAGIGVGAESFPLPVPDWPRFPEPRAPPEVTTFTRNNPVYFVPGAASPGELTREQLVLTLPAREDLTQERDPISQLSFARRAGRIRVSLFDWPGSSGTISQGGDQHYPPGNFTRLTGPYRTYREALLERMENARRAYATVIDPYNERLKILMDNVAPTFEGEWWPYVTPGFTKRRAAFVYPDPGAFRAAHAAGTFTVFGVEFLDSDGDLDLAGIQTMRGPGTLGAKTRMVVGSLAREGDRPLTLIAGTGLTASGQIQASLICPHVTGNPALSDARISGTLTLETLDPETAGSFTVTPDPALAALDLTEQMQGVVVNISPAPAVVFGTRE